MVKLNPGDILDNTYKVLSFPYKGGMSDVYKAMDLSNNRIVAIKIPYPGKEDKIRDFSLEHPNLTKIYPPPPKRSCPYQVMEFVEGKSIKEYIQQYGHLSVEKSVEITIELCNVLKYLHNNGIIHQDLKSNNIIITKNKELKILDLGLAYKKGDTPTSWKDFLSIGGTPEYFAPERESGVLDYRSDLYSLGVLLYEMLTGRVPFTGANSREVIEKHKYLVPPALTSFNIGVPKKLEQIVLKLLAKVPQKRFNSVSQLAEVLRKFLKSYRRGGIFLRKVPLLKAIAVLLFITFLLVFIVVIMSLKS